MAESRVIPHVVDRRHEVLHLPRASTHVRALVDACNCGGRSISSVSAGICITVVCDNA